MNSRAACGFELKRRIRSPWAVDDDAGTSVWRSALSACGFPELADLAVSHTAVLEAFSAVDGRRLLRRVACNVVRV